MNSYFGMLHRNKKKGLLHTTAVANLPGIDKSPENQTPKKKKKRLHTTQFYICEVQEQAKLICSNRG